MLNPKKGTYTQGNLGSLQSLGTSMMAMRGTYLGSFWW